MLQYMQEENLIKNEDVELYQYGIHLMLLKLLHYCSILIIGLFLGRGIELFIFLFAYTIIRSYIGGYHAKKSRICLLISIAMIFFIHVTIDIVPDIISLIIVLISTVIICMFSPIQSQEKPMKINEIKRNQVIARFMAITLFILFIVFYITKFFFIYLPIGYSLLFSSFFLLLALKSEE